MKLKMIIVVLVTAALVFFLPGCDSGMHYPEGWIVQTEENETGDIEKAEETEGTTEESNLTEIKPEDVEFSNEINFFFDTSGSMRRSPEVIQVHSAASKAGAGMSQRYYAINADKNLIKTDEKLALSGQYGRGAILDIIGSVDIPIDPEGVNVLTTDLQSSTTGTEFGEFLVGTGCNSYSFYVFTMDYNGSVDFKMYTSTDVQETVSVSDCVLSREFLLVVFGNESMVKTFDESFQKKLDGEVTYDVCHVTYEEFKKKSADNILRLTSSKCFLNNVANITYDNTYFCYGLSLEDVSSEKFTYDNTFVYKKSTKSANDDRDAVKVLLYSVPETVVPSIIDKKVLIQEYDSKSKAYVDSEVNFDVAAEAYFDGIPASDDESLNTKLGGNIIARDTPAFGINIENTSLPKGLYAIEITMVFETDDKEDFYDFACLHSSGLEDYVAALKTECEPKIVDGVLSTSKYTRIADGTSVYSKLLDFEKIADQLIANGITKAEENSVIIRLIIDNR